MKNNKLLNYPLFLKALYFFDFQNFKFFRINFLNNKKTSNFKKEKLYSTTFAFTLAEILAVLVILGIVASLIIPSAMQKQIEKMNRTKIKKALSTYNKALEQYYMIDYSADQEAKYKNENKAILQERLAATREINNSTDLTSEEKTAKRKEINSFYSQKVNNLKAEYTNKFINYFKINKTESSSDTTYYRMNDGLWWYFGNNPNMLSVIVAFDIKNPNTHSPYTSTELQNLASSKENKAFYLLGKKENYMTTPILNQTGGVNLDEVDFMYIIKNPNNDLLKQKKLNAYLNNKKDNYIVDSICTSNSCCDSKNGTCIYTKTDGMLNYYGSSGLTKDYQKYENGEKISYKALMKDGGNFEFNYKENSLKVTYNDGKEACYIQSSNNCTIPVSAALDLYYSSGSIKCCFGYCNYQKTSCK